VLPEAWRELGRLGLIAVGGALGAIARYQLGGWVMARAGPGFPWGTLVINVSGSFVLGFFATLTLERFVVARPWFYLVAIGFLGAYTTFSTFSLETMNLLMTGSLARALGNIFGSVVLSLAAAWAGIVLGRVL
jgi:CrcB protein